MGAGVVSRKMAAVVPAVIPPLPISPHRRSGQRTKGYPEVGGGGLIDTLMLAGDSPSPVLVSKAPEPAFTTAAGSFRKVWKLTEQIS